MRNLILRSLAAPTFGVLGLSVALLASPTTSGPQVVPGQIVTSREVVALGRALFFDKSLSNPPGMACVSCHDPSTGYTYPASWVNQLLGTVPGGVAGRAGNRRPPMVAYAPYLPPGPPHYSKEAQAWVGGLFWDGRVVDAEQQVRSPLVNPNEMNSRVHNLGDTKIVIDRIKSGPTANLFMDAYGKDVFSKPPVEVFNFFTKAIVAFEASPEVAPFTSKYDAYLAGKATLTPAELLGLRFFTGREDGRPGGPPFKKSVHCMDCHALSDDLSKTPDIFTNSCYANLGVPRNPLNLFYSSIDRRSNSVGYNRFGRAYVDMGLGDVLYDYLGMPEWRGLDPLHVNGAFKAPSLRNVDMRPNPGFTRAYMHNGALKSLKAVVHFYNTRNLTTVPGEVIDYTKPHPYAGLKGKPLWAPPECLDPNTIINPTGISSGFGSRGFNQAPVRDPDAMQIGNLRLNDFQEDAIVAFLKILTDGYFKR